MKSILNMNKILNYIKKYRLPILIFSLVRIVGYVYMFFNPFWGLVLSFVLDFVDSTILYMFNVPEKDYHHIDKPLDYLQYILLLPLAFNTPVFVWVVVALLLRSIATLFYIKTENRLFFVLVPNFTEYILFLYYLGIEFGNENLVFDIRVLLLLVIFKLIQEVSLHASNKHNAYLSWRFLKIPQLFKDMR